MIAAYKKYFLAIAIAMMSNFAWGMESSSSAAQEFQEKLTVTPILQAKLQLSKNKSKEVQLNPEEMAIGDAITTYKKKIDEIYKDTNSSQGRIARLTSSRERFKSSDHSELQENPNDPSEGAKQKAKCR